MKEVVQLLQQLLGKLGDNSKNIGGGASASHVNKGVNNISGGYSGIDNLDQVISQVHKLLSQISNQSQNVDYSNNGNTVKFGQNSNSSNHRDY